MQQHNQLQEETLAQMAARLRDGRNKKAVADASGVNLTTLNRLESGTRRPRLQSLQRLADFYQIPLETLTNAPPPPEHSKRQAEYLRTKNGPGGLPTLLEDLRDHRTIKDIAAQSGVSQSTIIQLETARTSLTPLTAERLGNYFGIEPKILLQLQDKNLPAKHRPAKPNPYNLPPPKPDPQDPPDPLHHPLLPQQARTLATAAQQELDQWTNSLKPSDRDILEHRINAPEPQSLKQVGNRLSVTRERVRQKQVVIIANLRRRAAASTASNTRRYLTLIRETTGIAAPITEAENALALSPGQNNYRTLLLHLAGPYTEHNGWLLLESKKHQDPVAYAVHPLLPGDRIDLEALRPKLATWGLHPSRNRRWTKAQAHAHDEAGMLFVKPSSATSRAIVLLEVSGQPKSTAELTGVSDSRSINNMLRLEPRVSRTTHNLLALTKWNLPRRDPHTVRNIQQALRKNGPMTLEALKDLMAAHHGALPNTVKSAVSVPAFVQEGDTIRLRQFSEMPYVIPKPNGPVPTKSTFILGPGHVAKLHKLTQPHIKGSSIQAGKTVAAVLELPTETVTQFRDEDGNPVRISFSSTSMSGPTIHSLRPILRAKQARQGDHILITFHRDSLKATLDVIDVTNLQPGWQAVGRLTGLDGSASTKTLASALQCQPENIRLTLARRRDTEVMDLLPTAEGQ